MSTSTATLPYSATVDEAARLSGLSISALYDLIREGKIEGRKRGRRTLILMDGVRKHIEALPKIKLKEKEG